MKLCSGSTLLVLAGLVASGAAHAQLKPDDIIKFRKGAYQVIGWEMRPLGLMVKGEMPYNKEVFAHNAAVIETMSRVVPEAFVAGTDKGETRARHEIWSDAGKFKSALERFQNEATKMNEVAKTGNFDQIKVQFGALAKSCGNCHDDFRNK